MYVEVYQAHLIIEKKSVRLTRAIARQFPLLNGNIRRDKAETGQEANKPLGKVRAQALKHQDVSTYYHGWLYLIEDEEAGLAWTAAIVPMPQYAAKIIEQGGWIDTPKGVPTLIL